MTAAKSVPPDSTRSEQLSGTWSLDTEVQSSSMRAFEGLQLGYRLQLNQQGDRITGHGQKIRENGRELTAPARTPISVHGTIEGNQLVLTYTEQGHRRASHGTFVLQRDDDGTLRGKFSSDAAQSSGLAAARRPRN
ncbi:MAG: hypothetical protein M3478_07655 [Planctomycetota bacterium]|nr:hypothetical protein [Planctomycetota bacterium]